MNNYYTVVKGDTLTKIARTTGTTTSDLVKLNQIADPNRLAIGHRLALRKEVVTGVQPLFLDRNRDPIAGLEYLLEYAGKIIKAVTPENGLGRMVFTDAATDEVRIFVKRLDGTLKEIGRVVSGYGNKLVTVLSPSVKVEAETERNPPVKPGESPNATPSKPTFDPKTKQPPTTDKNDFGVEQQSTTTPDGWPLSAVKGDIPDLSFLGNYVGGDITNEDIKAAAEYLKCEPGLIYAISKQESGHSSFIKIGKRIVPKILYERHHFAKYTKHQFSKKYRDISGPAYHKTINERTVTKNKNGKKIVKFKVVDAVTGAAPVPEDVYGPSGLAQYRRLAKAFHLDKAAALKSTSWGKFQIMGFNHQMAGYENVFTFVKAMSSSDAAHLKAFLRFAKSRKELLDGLREKNFKKIAEGHNGADWKSVNPDYAYNLELFYKEYETKK